jgi:hypothetical protein
MRGTPCKLPNHLHSQGFDFTDGCGTLYLRQMNHECKRGLCSSYVSTDYYVRRVLFFCSHYMDYIESKEM